MVNDIKLTVSKMADASTYLEWSNRESIHIYTILPKVLGCPLLMNRFDYFSNSYEYKS